MGQKELKRWHLMKMAEVGKITLSEGGRDDKCILSTGQTNPTNHQGKREERIETAIHRSFLKHPEYIWKISSAATTNQQTNEMGREKKMKKLPPEMFND